MVLRCLILPSLNYKTSTGPSSRPLRNKTRLSQSLLLIKQIRPRTPQINNLRTAIPVPLQPRTICTVVCITYPNTTTDDAFSSRVAKSAFVADVDEGRWADVRVADWASGVVSFAEAAYADACLAAAHY
jgi:hypothetical protein